MRTEEVENSIKELTEITDLVKEEIKNNDENTTAILDITDLKSLDITLNYISKLEELPNKIREYITSHTPSDIGICGNSKKHYYTLGEDSVDKILELLEGE